LSYDGKRYAIPGFVGTLEALDEASERFNRMYEEMKKRVSAVMPMNKKQTKLAQARNLLKQCAGIIEEDLKAQGSCNHAVGICVCGIVRVLEDVQDFLRKP